MAKNAQTSDGTERGYPVGNSVAVYQMSALLITGDVIPPIWRKYITRENGKPHDPAVNILGDIVYWHRPIEITNEAGAVVGYRKRFAADWLYAQPSKIGRRPAG